MRHITIVLMVLLILAVGIIPSLAQDAETAADDQAYVRVAHFAPQTGNVDVQMDDSATDMTGVEYGTISDWVAVDPGGHNFSLGATDGSSDISSATPVEVDLEQGTWTTLAITGANDDGSLAVEQIVEDFSEMLPGTAYVTFVNAIVGGPTIDIIRDDITYVTGLLPPGESQGVDAGGSWFGILDDMDTYTFQAVDGDNPDNVLAELNDIKLNENEVHLIAAIGTTDSGDDADVQLILNSTNLARAEILQGELEAPGTIVEALQAEDGLAPIADAIQRAGLTDMLSGEGPYTLFVPADFAIDEIPEDIMNDPDALQNFLEHHIVEGDYRSQDVFKAGTLTALNGDTLTIEERGENAFVNDAQIIDVNIPATNGTIHIINQPLMTDSMASG